MPDSPPALNALSVKPSFPIRIGAGQQQRTEVSKSIRLNSGRWALNPVGTQFGIKPHAPELSVRVTDMFPLVGIELLIATC